MTQQISDAPLPDGISVLTREELAEVSAGVAPLLVVAVTAAAITAFGVGYAIGTAAYNLNMPGTHWV